MKISVVMGTRPEIIKLAPVVWAGRRAGHDVKVVFTGQHRELAIPFMKLFELEPDVSLDVMAPGQSLTELSARVLASLDRHVDEVTADAVLVQGDTSTALMAAYWAFCRRCAVGHVEAGLRTYKLDSPFPEEGNRQLIGRISNWHFAPTDRSMEALQKEKVSGQVFQVGNTVIDSLEFVRGRIANGDIDAADRLSEDVLSFVGSNRLVLVTGHRRESFGSEFENLCRGILRIVDERSDVRIVYPVHLNPQVQEPVRRILGAHPRIRLIEPQGYVPFIELMERADVLLTDSGGVQEEGPSFRKPIVVMREVTERPEGVEAGFSTLVGTNEDLIFKMTLQALDEGCTTSEGSPYGDGCSGERIVRLLEERA